MRPSQGFGEGIKTIFFSREHGNKKSKTEGKGEQKQFWGTGNIENQDFGFGEQGKCHFFFRGTREQVPLGGPRRYSDRLYIQSVWSGDNKD